MKHDARLTPLDESCNTCTMTTTETITPEAAHDLLVRTAANHGVDAGIGTPDSGHRNYSLAEAIACAAICHTFTTQELNGVVILTGHNPATGDYRWYIDLTPRPADPWS